MSKLVEMIRDGGINQDQLRDSLLGPHNSYSRGGWKYHVAHRIADFLRNRSICRDDDFYYASMNWKPLVVVEKGMINSSNVPRSVFESFKDHRYAPWFAMFLMTGVGFCKERKVYGERVQDVGWDDMARIDFLDAEEIIVPSMKLGVRLLAREHNSHRSRIGIPSVNWYITNPHFAGSSDVTEAHSTLFDDEDYRILREGVRDYKRKLQDGCDEEERMDMVDGLIMQSRDCRNFLLDYLISCLKNVKDPETVERGIRLLA